MWLETGRVVLKMPQRPSIGRRAAGGAAPPGYTIQIPVPVVTGGNTSGVVGQAFSYQILASNLPILSYSASGLPNGLSINTGNGLITGTPTTAGTSNVTLTARNATGTSL